MKLHEYTSLIRSKNAGPFELTFDIMFSTQEDFQRVKESGVLTPELFARLYRCDVDKVQFYTCENARAFKYTIPRPITQGDLGDGDLHGGQQYAPLVNIDIPARDIPLPAFTD